MVDSVDSEGSEKVVDEKVLSRTDAFKGALQEYYSKALGKKVSRADAWLMFKGTISVIVDNVRTEGRLSLSGVGAFEILRAGARKDKIFSHNYVPRFRFRTGSKINDFLDENCEGVHKSPEDVAALLKERPELQAQYDSWVAKQN